MKLEQSTHIKIIIIINKRSKKIKRGSYPSSCAVNSFGAMCFKPCASSHDTGTPEEEEAVKACGDGTHMDPHHQQLLTSACASFATLLRSAVNWRSYATCTKDVVVA